jgi:putative PIN family toxin of toxin-antitoxin system
VDTNVFISAVLFGGLPAKALEIIKQKKAVLVVSPEIEVEIISKLAAFSVPPQLIEDVRFVLEEETIKTVPKRKIKVCRDPRDNMFLEAAAESSAEFLVTGDKDLLILKTFETTLILPPRLFLESLVFKI